jgi:hypothetical protein
MAHRCEIGDVSDGMSLEERDFLALQQATGLYLNGSQL